jgi:hypothetical protein
MQEQKEKTKRERERERERLPFYCKGRQLKVPGHIHG